MMREHAIQKDEGFRAEAEGVRHFFFALLILAEAYTNIINYLRKGKVD